MPTLWKWKTVEPFVRRAPELVSAEKAARRVVMLVNPGRKEWSAAAGLLYTGVQVMNPGEFTSAHRHQASALRFVMEGRGAYTVVDGEKMTLGARDLVLTPNGTWHDHGIEAERHAMHLAGRARHPADELARRKFLRSASEVMQNADTPLARKLVEALLAAVHLQMGRVIYVGEGARRP